MSIPDDLRPARTTPRLKLPVPGDVGPADYVTDTGALADRLDLVSQLPAYASVYAATVGDIPPGVHQAIGFDTLAASVEPDPDHEWLVAGRVHVPIPGLYSCAAQLDWPQYANGDRRLALVSIVEGSQVLFGAVAAVATVSLPCQQRLAVEVPLNPDDATMLSVYQSAGVAIAGVNTGMTVTLTVPLTTDQVDDLRAVMQTADQLPWGALVLPP